MLNFCGNQADFIKLCLALIRHLPSSEKKYANTTEAVKYDRFEAADFKLSVQEHSFSQKDEKSLIILKARLIGSEDIIFSFKRQTNFSMQDASHSRLLPTFASTDDKNIEYEWSVQVPETALTYLGNPDLNQCYKFSQKIMPDIQKHEAYIGEIYQSAAKDF